jgi:hypothetical protein
MAKKSSTHSCYSCDAEFTVKFSDEEIKLAVEFCPFCGDTLDTEEDVPEEEEDEDTNDTQW